MKPYEKYKNSGIDGVGDIPSRWQLLNFRYLIGVLTDFTANGAFADLAKNVEYLEAGYSRLIRLTDLRENLENSGVYVSEDAHNYLSKSSLFGGEILLAKVGAYAGLAWRVPNLEQPATLGPNMFLLKFNDKVDTDFAYLCLTSEYLHSQLLNKAVSSAQPKLNKNDVRSCVFILPTVREQQQIVKYADYHTAIIDDLISKKETLIEKLKEKRQTVINETITKGLDPNASMKDSGIEWIGSVPKKWDLRRLKFLYQIKKEIAGELGHKVLSVTQKGIKIRDIDNLKGQLSMDYSKYQLVNEGDFIMNHMDLLTGYIDISQWQGVTSPDYRVFNSINSNILDRFYLYLFQFCYSNKIFFGLGQGVSQLGRWRMPADSFNNFIVPVPSLKEQIEIVAYLDEKIDTINSLVEKEQIVIDKLKEYRQSLISEAVTGKIDVRDWEPPSKN